MLDAEDERYQPYSLRHGVRDPVAGQYNAASFSTLSTRFWSHLRTLTQIVDQGDPALGLQAYNGGLFASGHAIVDEIELTDAELAPIIHDLSHTAGGAYISYRSLEVQQLGSIYERLLERVPRRDEDGHVEVTVSPYARKDSGSYYTPQELVDLVVEQTLTPLVEERIEAFRRDPVAANDPAAAILDLTVLDPAMGSGHFLITAIDWLTDRLNSLVNREWDEAPGYVSPIGKRLEELQAEHEGLGDDILLQRMVLKRCIYGVDKNDMAVELAKVALWLHTFTGELPLPYLDHRIRAGDSLLGISARSARDYLAEWGRKVRLAFQVRDDILGIWGDPNVTGKSNQNDMARHKKTLPVIAALAEPRTRAAIERLYAHEEPPAAEIEAVSAQMEADGVKATAEEHARRYVDEASGILDSLGLREDERVLLAAVARYLIERAG